MRVVTASLSRRNGETKVYFLLSIRYDNFDCLIKLYDPYKDQGNGKLTLNPLHWRRRCVCYFWRYWQHTLENKIFCAIRIIQTKTSWRSTNRRNNRGENQYFFKNNATRKEFFTRPKFAPDDERSAISLASADRLFTGCIFVLPLFLIRKVEKNYQFRNSIQCSSPTLSFQFL